MDFNNLHQILKNLYNEMLPLCEDMTGVATGLAGLGALFYIAYRIWQSLARAEPIDVFPLLRPFCLGLCIMFFPTLIIGSINTVLSPLVNGTHQLLETQTVNMQEYAKQKDEIEYKILMQDPTTAYLVDNEEFDKQLQSLGWGFSDLKVMMKMAVEVGMYKLKRCLRNIFRDFLELIYQGASLCIDTLRTFFLIVLTILGPISFALSVWDGFQSTLTQWLTRYISIYLWLPVADLFGCIMTKIQIMILTQDIESLHTTGATSLDASTAVYIVFMLIGIIGYFTVPSVANWIIQSGGAGNYGRNVNSTVVSIGRYAAGTSGSAIGNVTGRLTGH